MIENPRIRFTVTFTTECSFEVPYDGTANGWIAAQRRVYDMSEEQMFLLSAQQGEETRHNLWAIAERSATGKEVGT